MLLSRARAAARAALRAPGPAAAPARALAAGRPRRPPRAPRKGGKKGGKAPPLKDTVRQLYRKVHPDLFAQAPEQQAVNAASFQELQGFLDSVGPRNKLEDRFPPKGSRQLPFFVKRGSGEPQLVQLQLTTTGGDCRKLVQRSLGDFFAQVGLAREFAWEEGSWQPLRLSAEAEAADAAAAAADRAEEAAERAEAEAVAAYHAAGAAQVAAAREAASTSTAAFDPASCPPELATLLEDIEPQLIELALGPYLPEQRKDFVDRELIPSMEAQGLEVGLAVQAIWDGERDFDVIARGVRNDNVKHLLWRVLEHTVGIDEDIAEQTTQLEGEVVGVEPKSS